jgi:Carboxypeptidase regulatory-like domain
MRNPIAPAATFVVMLLLLVFVPSLARAQTAPSELEVRVTDAAGKPLGDARIFLSGGPGVVTSALTPRDGIIRFADVQSGLYAIRVALAGYDGVDVNDVDVLPGRRKIVEVALSRSRPKGAPSASRESTSSAASAGGLAEIGRVQARPPVSVTSVDVDEGNPVRRVSENLADALDKIAGVSVIQAPQTGTLTISLRNQDASSTLATAGGVPLAGGAAGALQSVAADLSSGVSVDTGNNPGNVGGSVNFRTLEPTKTWQSQLTVGYGSYERSSAAFSLSGSAKKLGIALQHAVRGDDDRLAGLTFADTSGFAYPHDGATDRYADFLKLRYAVGAHFTATAGYLGGHTRAALECFDFVTNVPCGYGPGNATSSDTHQLNLGLNGQIGNVAVFAGTFTNAYHLFTDQANRYVSGVPEPFVGSTRSYGTGWYEFARVAIKRHTIGFGYGAFSGGAKASYSGAFQGPGSSAYRFGYASVNDELKMSDRWSVVAGAGTSTSIASTSASAYGTVTLRPSRQETLALSGSVGGDAGGFSVSGPFGEPANGTYNCPAGEVRVAGPGDSAVPTSESSLQLAYDRRGSRGTLHAAVYDRVDHGSSLQAQFPLLGLPADQIPPGYVDAIRAIWNAPAICGGRPFDPGRIYLAEQIAGPAVRYRGIDASGQLVLGRQTVALPSYSINAAILEAADARLLASGSPYFLGAQLPFRPLHRAGLTLDTRQPRGNLEYIVDGRWTSANNPAGLGSYVVVSAGATWQAARGRLTFLATNLFNADTGLFATREFAQPLPLRGGGTYVPVPTLLQPRSFTLLYTVRAGRLK